MVVALVEAALEAVGVAMVVRALLMVVEVVCAAHQQAKAVEGVLVVVTGAEVAVAWEAAGTAAVVTAVGGLAAAALEAVDLELEELGTEGVALVVAA